jgi:hypothetical protein
MGTDPVNVMIFVLFGLAIALAVGGLIVFLSV